MRRPAPHRWSCTLALLATLILAAAGAVPTARAAGAPTLPADLQPVGDVSAVQDFPHVAAYLFLSSDGHQLDSDAMVAKLARFNLAVIPASPTTEKYAGRLQQLRAANPSIIVLAYFPGDFMWDGAQYPEGNIYGDCWRMFQRHDWWVYSTKGTPFQYFGSTFDLTNPEAQDSLAWFIAGRVLAPGMWDGLFLDDFCESNYWKNGTEDQYLDINRDGQPDERSVYEPIWKAGTDSLAAKIRRLVGPTMPIVGNCSYGSKWTTMNGWMREDFPRLGTWVTNMFSSSGGYLVNEQRYLSPHYNFVYSTSAAPPNIFSPYNINFMRYCLASTLLADGFYMFDARMDTVLVSDIWYDEYDDGGRARGYLGQALGGYYQQVGTLTSPDLFVNTGFESGLANWAPYSGVGTILADPSERHAGSYSAHVVVPSATEVTTQIHLQQTVSLPYGSAWSVSFWARAATPRDMWVFTQRTESPYTIFCATPVTLTTGWHQYQVTFANSTGTTVPINVQLQFGQQVGDVWVDDVHLQSGASGVYRRDFQRGTAMVNNSTSPVVVSLEKPYQRLLGSQDPGVNDGSVITQLTIQGLSGAILKLPSGTADLTPPAAINDLRVLGAPQAPRPLRVRRQSPPRD
jgi:hypothetical protein